MDSNIVVLRILVLSVQLNSLSFHYANLNPKAATRKQEGIMPIDGLKNTESSLCHVRRQLFLHRM
jgi:hypothetical protein